MKLAVKARIDGHVKAAEPLRRHRRAGTRASGTRAEATRVEATGLDRAEASVAEADDISGRGGFDEPRIEGASLQQTPVQAPAVTTNLRVLEGGVSEPTSRRAAEATASANPSALTESSAHNDAPVTGLTVQSLRASLIDGSAAAANLTMAANNDAVVPLPERTAQEFTLGRSLAHLDVHAGSSTRAALDAMGADGAALGSEIFLRTLPAAGAPENEGAARTVLAHEVAHATAATPAATTPATATIATAAGASSEQAAEQVAAALAPSVVAFHHPAATAAAATPVPRELVPLASPGRDAVGLRVTSRNATERPPTPTASIIEGDPAAAFTREQTSARSSGNTPPFTSGRAGSHASSAEGASTESATVPAAAAAGPALPAAGSSEGAATISEAELAGEELRVITASPGEDISAPAAPALEGEGVDGVTSAFVRAPPSQKAYAQETLNADLEREAQTSASEQIAALPPIEKKLGGEAEMGTVTDELQPETSALADIVPTETSEPVAEDVVPAAPENEPFAGNDALPGWLRGLFGGSSASNAQHIDEAIDNVETIDDSVETSPGPPPPVPLEGATDPAQIAEQYTQGLGQANDGRVQARAAVVDGPGPEVVQPLEMNEQVELDGIEQPALEEQPALDGTEAFKQAQMPQDVVATFDEQNAATMEASLATAEQQVADATATRDADWQAELDSAHEQNAELVDTAQQEQNDAVESQRQRIQDERQNTLDRQEDEVLRVRDEADELDEDQRQEIDDRVANDEVDIEARFEQAEKDAEDEVDAGERQAEAEKREAEKEAEDQSWWDRATSWISDAISALVDAVNAIIDAVREAVNALLDAVRDAVVALIEAATAFILEAIELFGELLKVLVDELLGELFPQLAAALTEFIDAAVEVAQQAVQAISDTLVAGVNALVDAVKAGLNAVLDAFQAAVNFAAGVIQAALAGDWGEVLRLLLEAALSLAGISSEDFYAFVGRVSETIAIIVNDPLDFLGNLFGALALGFNLFIENIVDHLRQGFFEWVVGPLGELGIILPETWDIWSILGIVLQVLGLTQEGIRLVIVEELGETAGAVFDFIWRYVEALITGGWRGLWEQLQQDLSSLWEMVVDGIKGWLIQTIITQGTLKLLSLLDPTGISAIVQVLLTAWQIYTFLRDNLQRIWGVVTAIVNTISEIALGVLQTAGEMVEGALASLVPIAISLLANLLGLGGITARVREIIENIRDTVRNAIRNLIRRVRGMFSGGGETEAAQEDASSLTGDEAQGAEGVGTTVPFAAAGQRHRLWIDPSGTGVTVMVASTEEPLANKLDRWERELDTKVAQDHQAEAAQLLATTWNQLTSTEQQGLDEERADQAAASGESGDVAAAAQEHAETVDAERALSRHLMRLFELFGEGTDLAVVFEQQIGAAHPDARTDLQRGASQLNDEQPLPETWSTLTHLMKTRGNENQAGKIALKPLSVTEHNFGNHSTLEVALATETAGQQLEAEGKAYDLRVQDDALDWISRRKQVFHGPGFEQSRDALWNEATGAGEARDTILAEIKAKLETDGASVSPQLVEALQNTHVYEFLQQVLENRQQHFTTANFEEQVWNVPANQTYLTNRFRNPGDHEWIPTNYIPNVLARASAQNVLLGKQWILLQERLRTDTSELIFDPNISMPYATTGTIEVSGETHRTLTGHVGALWGMEILSDGTNRFKQLTSGQGPWHDSLRAAFDAADPEKPADAVDALRQAADRTIWGGGTHPADLFPVYYRSANESAEVTIVTLATEQGPIKAALLSWFDQKKEEFK